ncbi:amidohydrolase [Kineosporia sp. A_224]|uniref:amidohydrolase n=1 Tax=Kineosporia sp. A_224 TaxID=1962180 RepID=UPI000B4A9D5B|nr:amidohydrolase [Kineosporia sp. A_224]
MTAGDLGTRLRRWRHALHEHPETAFTERWTSDYLAAELEALGLVVTRGLGGTGLVATLRRGAGGAGASGTGAIGLRADMDALPLHERGDLPYRSRTDGVMHACGHDGHMAMVLGAAHVLATEGGFAGTVHLVLQPAEEPGRGADAMIADGLFERFGMDMVFGIHNTPGHPAGRLSTRSGPVMASEDNFEIRVTGRGGHASQPQMVVDPLVVGAEIVLALQTVVARAVPPSEAAVLSCTEFVTDGARNAIPGHVVVRGDTRSFSPAVQDLLDRRIREVAHGICAAHGATCEVTYTHEFAPTVNHPDATALAVAAARLTVPEDLVDADVAPFMGSEDFGVLGRAVPGCFVFLGNGDEPGAGGNPLHSSDYTFNDDVLETGVRFYANLVRTALPEAGA